MARSKSETIEQTVALWKSNPTVKLREFVTIYHKQYGTAISIPAAFLAKKRAGLTQRNRKNAKSSGTTVEQLKHIYQLAKDMGGIKEVRKQLKLLDAIAKAAGGYDQLDQCLTMIEELKKK